jgi:predicted membrane protein
MKTHSSRIIAGLCIVILGFMLLLSNLNLYNVDELFRTWWPLILVGAGIFTYLNNRSNYLWALLLVGFGAMFQLRELDLLTVNPWQLFWPGVIIFVGLSVIMNQGTGKNSANEEEGGTTAIMGASNVRNDSDDFTGSNVTAVMGGVKLDLRKATIKKEATVKVFCFWGGVEIIVPKDVIVKNRATVLMAGVEDTTDAETASNAPVLYIAGDVIMSGVEIKN